MAAAEAGGWGDSRGGRDPIGVAVQEPGFGETHGCGIADGMLERLSRLVRMRDGYQVVIPPGRIRRSLLGDDPKDVRKVVEGIDHLSNIGILYRRDRVGRRHGYGPGTAAIVDPVHVVGPRKRIAVAGEAEDVEPFAGEEVAPGIDSSRSQLPDPIAKAIKIVLVELGQVKFQFAVGGDPGPIRSHGSGETVKSGGETA